MSLIEVTVGVALMALISIGVVSAVRTGQRSFERVVRAEVRTMETVQFQQFLREALEQAFPDTWDDEGVRRLPLEGDHHTLIWLARDSWSIEGTGHRRHQLIVSRGSNGNLELRVLQGRPSSSNDGEVLARHAESIDFNYKGAQEEWQSVWHRDDLPKAVRIRINFAPESTMRWPDFVVTPRLTAGPQCQFDVVALQCRPL